MHGGVPLGVLVARREEKSVACFEWVKLCLDFLADVAWPLAAVTIALLARRIVRDLAARMTEFEGGGVRARFEKEQALFSRMDVVGMPPLDVKDLDAQPPEGERPSS